MTKRLLLMMAMLTLLLSAAPTYATYWGDKSWGNNWGDNWGDKLKDHLQDKDWSPKKDDKPKHDYQCNWDDWFDGWDDIAWTKKGDSDNNKVIGDKNWWKNHNNNKNWPSRDEIKNWLKNHDWKKDGNHGGWHCKPHDNPVPEPATAGLAMMSLAALSLATRRRK